MDWQATKEFLSPCFPEEVCTEMELLYPGELREIRIRADRPVVFCTVNRMTALKWRPDSHEVALLAEALCDHGLYTHSEETREGYVPLRGGHRMGLSGHVCMHGLKPELRKIGSLCIRIASSWPGCADGLMGFAFHHDRVNSMLIIGAPGSGKTTMLRDLARQLGSGAKPCQVAMIDERGELAASVDGVPQLDVGEWTDVLDGCPREYAVPWLVRSMSAQVIVTDELGGSGDAAAVREAIACGVAVMASVHASSLHELAGRSSMASLMASRCFDWFVLLHPDGGGQIQCVYDRTGSPVKSL